NYKYLYQPVMEALNTMSVAQPEQKGRNDLLLNNKKISGAAMAVHKGRVDAGYSLLLDPDYESRLAVSRPNQKKINSHGIQSVRSRVGAIRPHLATEYKNITVWEFTDVLLQHLLNIDDVQQAKRYELTREDWKGIDEIAAEKYNNWDWNYGRFQQFEYQVSKRFSIGTIHIGLKIIYAKISDISITGDFFGTENIQDLEATLIGVRLKKEELLKAISSINIADYFNGISKEEFIQFIMEENE